MHSIQCFGKLLPFFLSPVKQRSSQLMAFEMINNAGQQVLFAVTVLENTGQQVLLCCDSARECRAASFVVL